LRLQSEKIPLVFFDRGFENLDIPKVVTNDYDCGFMAAKHLLERGCRNPVFLSLSYSLSICAKRAEGFSAALLAAGIGIEQKIISYTGNEDGTIAEIRQLLLSNHKHDGIVASVVSLAFEVYLLAQENGIEI